MRKSSRILSLQMLCEHTVWWIGWACWGLVSGYCVNWNCWDSERLIAVVVHVVPQNFQLSIRKILTALAKEYWHFILSFQIWQADRSKLEMDTTRATCTNLEILKAQRLIVETGWENGEKDATRSFMERKHLIKCSETKSAKRASLYPEPVTKALETKID